MELSRSRPLRVPVGCEAGCANKLLGCAISRPTGPSDPPVMHGTDRRQAVVRWCLARSEVHGGRWLGGSRDRGGTRGLAWLPVTEECFPGLKRTTANLRSSQFNVFPRLEVRTADSRAGERSSR
eukprot:7253145-Prymnesium_polylepis.6